MTWPLTLHTDEQDQGKSEELTSGSILQQYFVENGAVKFGKSCLCNFHVLCSTSHTKNDFHEFLDWYDAAWKKGKEEIKSP